MSSLSDCEKYFKMSEVDLLNEVKNKFPQYVGIINQEGLSKLERIHQVELFIWNDEFLVEKYEENLRDMYVVSVGYSGAGYWFMAGFFERLAAFVKTIKENS